MTFTRRRSVWRARDGATAASDCGLAHLHHAGRGTTLAEMGRVLRSSSAACAAVVASVAGAGLASSQPVDPYAEPAPAPAAGVPAPGPVEPVVAPAPPWPDPSWTPLDDDGWPRGVSLEELRAHRRCGLAETLPGPGEVIPCRPRVYPEVPQLRFGVDWTSGLVAGDVATTGGAQGLGVELDVTLARRLALGARYELIGAGEPTAAPEMSAIAGSQRVLAQARWRTFTDEVDRDAIAVGVGLGWAFSGEPLGGDAPVARAALTREVGWYLDDEHALTAALEVAYARTLAERPVETVLASARFGFELNIAEPKNLGTRDEPLSERLWSGGEVYASPFFLGLGYSVGLRLLDHVHAVGTANFAFGRYRDEGTLQGMHGAWAGMGGLRLDAGWPGPAPAYLLVQAGPAWVGTEDGGEVRTLADAELGVLFQTCGGGAGAAVRLRSEVEDGVEVVSGAFVLRLAMGPGISSGRWRCRRDEGPKVVYMPTPPPPPPAPAPVAPVDDGGVAIDGGGAVGGGVVAGGDVSVGGTVVVTPPEPPPPVVIEVELGAVLFGGAVQVRVDPRLLPLGRLRAGGLIDVRLEGPPDQLAAFEGELRAILGRERIAIQGWARVPTTGSRVRAVFTIGARR